MIAKGIKFEIYEKEWMGEGPNACGYTYLDDDVAMGIWLMASYREHAHADMGEYAHAVDEALAEEEQRVMESARQAALAEGMDAEDAVVVAEYAVDDWSNRGDGAALADAVSFEYLESLKERMEEWLDDEERFSDECDPEGVEITEKREWLEAVGERLERRRHPHFMKGAEIENFEARFKAHLIDEAKARGKVTADRFDEIFGEAMEFCFGDGTGPCPGDSVPDDIWDSMLFERTRLAEEAASMLGMEARDPGGPYWLEIV